MYDESSTARTATVNGHRIHFHEAGSGPTVVMLHGAGPGVSGWSNFGANLPCFAAHFRTVIVDQPGFGRSEVTDYDGDYFTHSATTLVGLLDELGIERAHLVGNSLGGGVAARTALDHPDRVDRMVLMGPGGLTTRMFTPEPTLGHVRLYSFFETPEREQLATFMRGMVFDPDIVTDEMIDTRFAQSQRPGVGEAFTRMAQSFADPANAERVELWRHAHLIQHPTLLIWGREDLVNPYDGGLFAFSRMPHASLHVMAQCGHWAQAEKASEFNRTATGYLLQG